METTRKVQNFMLKLGVFAFSALALVTGDALAGDGWGDNTNDQGVDIRQQTFYANSPSGVHTKSICPNDVNGKPLETCNLNDPGIVTGPVDSGTPLRKFVDPLPGLSAVPGGPSALHDGSGKYIPLAVATKWRNAQGVVTGDDYYEIAAVEWKEKFHTDLANDSTVRGYVQIDPVATDINGGLDNGATPVPNSLAYALTNLDGSAVMIARPDASNATGFKMVQAYAVDKPHYLGPVISAMRGTPTRIKFINALPVGRAANGKRNGDLFLPVDETLPGAGFGPDGRIKFTQNRVEIHLHGGDNPWISDGTPHQWVAPAGEADAANPNSLASEFNVKHAAWQVEKDAAQAAVDVLPAPANLTQLQQDLANLINTEPKLKNYLRGVSAVNVPDMPNPGPGAMTYYFPNGESARLMFYHDHAFGLTRLNVYAGVAAGYLLNDGVEQQAVVDGKLPAEQIPLVFQDKTFVPKDITTQDARWDTTLWGKESDFWFPHVYETNQDPTSMDGTKPVGRWDWGPYFWPVFPSYFDRLPNGSHDASTQIDPANGFPLPYTEVTTTPEAFVDTPIVNGQAYPTLEVEPKSYRFRMLNAMNDRFINLGLYVAADKVTTDPNDPMNAFAQPTLCDGSLRPVPAGSPVGTVPTLPAIGDCTEVKMVNFDTSYPNLYYPPGSPRVITPNGSATFPTAGGLLDTGWGDTSGHLALFAGVPDPATAGPDIIQIGNEGGILAKAAVIPSTPMNYEANKRSTTMLNILERGLWLSPAGRADTVIDFSQYAGKTLILYNDAPAPLPAGDPRIDYYTGMGDYSTVGGHANVLPGYGPNDRTVMQIHVKALPPATPLVVATLENDVAALHALTQPKPVVPETRYNKAFPGIAAADTNARIYTGAIYLGKYNGLTFTPPEDIKYTDVPRLAGGGVCTTPANCAANLKQGSAFGKAGFPITAYVENKAIQELFEPTYGRMNATLGVELPFSSALTQTTIPLGYVDPATEKVTDGETQFWKITHNGVDSHPVHFHLVNVQVINRMGWDGTIKQPTDEEIGWKETVIMNPLEDVVVAVRAKAPKLPFGLPNSVRSRDPSQANSGAPGPNNTPVVVVQVRGVPYNVNLAVNGGFTQVDPITGNPAAVFNKEEDFGWEYVWHCHILGHEENDFMRAFVFNYWDDKGFQKNKDGVNGTDGSFVKDLITGNRVAIADSATIKPDVINDLQIAGNTLTWTDPTQAYIVAGNAVVQNPATLANPKNEIGFNLTRIGTPKPNNAVGVVSSKTFKLIANTESYADADQLDVANVDYTYKIAAYNQMGSAPSSNVAQAAPTIPVAPSGLVVPTVTSTSATLNWADNATNETTYKVIYSIGGGAPTTIVIPQQAGIGAMSYIVNGLLPNAAYDFQVAASNGAGDALSNVASNTTNATSATAVVVSNVTTNSASVAWANTNPGVLNAVNPEVLTVTPATVGIVVNGHDVTGLQPNTTYTFSVVLTGSNGTAAPAATAPATTNADVASNVTVSNLTATTATVNWTNPTTGGNAVLSVSPLVGVTVAANGHDVTGLTPNQFYTFSVVVTGSNGVASPAATATATTNAVVSGMMVSAVTANSVIVSWASPAGSSAKLTVLTGPYAGGTIIVPSGNSTTVTGLAANTLYDFSLVVIGLNGNALPAVTAQATTNAISAGVVTVGTITNTTANVSWTNLNPGTTTAVLTVSPNLGVTVAPNGHDVSGLTPYTLYTFSVVVTGTNHMPAAATTATAQTLATLVAATNVAASMNNATSITLHWTDMSVGETGYQVQMLRTAGFGIANWVTLPAAQVAGVLSAAGTGNTIVATVTVNPPGMTAGATYLFRVVPVAAKVVQMMADQVGPVSASGVIDMRFAPTTVVLSDPTSAAGTGEVVLSWGQAANNAATVTVQRKVGTGAGTWFTVATLPGNSFGYTDVGVIDGIYQYRVRNSNAVGSSAWTAALPIAGVTVSGSPVSLVAATIGAANLIANNQLTLAWVDNATGENGYQVQVQRTVNGAWAVIPAGQIVGNLTAGGNITATITTNMAGGSLYNFRVVPVNGVQVGAVSGNATINLTLVPSAVVIDSATPSAASVALAWHPVTVSNNTVSIQIQRRLQAVNGRFGAWANVVTLAGSATAYTDTTPGLFTGRVYQYQIRTSNPRGSSVWVPTVNITVP